MSSRHRPYFRYGIEQIEELFLSSQNDIEILKTIQNELEHRERPKAKVLKKKVDELLQQVSVRNVSPVGFITNPNKSEKIVGSINTSSERVAVECPICKTPNFVSTLDGIVQHLSCSLCKMPYEAQFKYGVMRTVFQPQSTTNKKNFFVKLVVVVFIFLITLALILK